MTKLENITMSEEIKNYEKIYEQELDKACDIIQELTNNMMKELESVEEFLVFNHEDIDSHILDSTFVLLEKLEDIVFRYSGRFKDNTNIKSGIMEISRKLNDFHYVLSTKIYDELL